MPNMPTMRKLARRIKVLPLESWMDTARGANEFDAVMWADMERSYPEIRPIVGREGYYLDRYTRTAWFEIGGKAYRCGRPADFEYRLCILNARRLTRREREAIQELERLRLCPPDLREVRWLDREAQNLHDLYWGARTHVYRALYE